MTAVAVVLAVLVAAVVAGCFALNLHEQRIASIEKRLDPVREPEAQ